jgi:N-acetylglutamate synthase-like GNAT family acetyltransferase
MPLTMTPQLHITAFTPEHQPGVDLLLSDIQNEYLETIYGSRTKKITDVYNLPGRQYWVVNDGDKMVGSIGVVLLADHNACLKSMFVQKEYRGGSTGIACRLLITAINYAIGHGAIQIILGTMVQFKAAQAFYLKHGFIPIREDQLPADFVKNPVDKVFFKLVIKEKHAGSNA